MNKKWVFIALTTLLAVLSVSCSKKRGFDITGTWIDKSNSGEYYLEITIDSVDYTKYHESVSANATFSFQEYHAIGNSTENRTIKLSGSDLKCSHHSHDDEDYYSTISFSYGSAIADYVTITFYPDGTAFYETPLSGRHYLSRN